MKIDWEDYGESWGYGPLSEAGVNKDEVAKVVAYREGENDCMNWLLILKMKDGRWAYVSAGCDYTGWDCQASGWAVYANSIAELIPEMDTEGRHAFGYEPTPDCGV